MKTILILISTMIVALTGCSSIERVELSQKERWVPEAQKNLLNEDADVTTRDGRGYGGTIVRLTTDSLWLQGESMSSEVALQLNQVSSIRPSRNYGAPIGGFLGGLLVGGLIGGAIGTAQEPGHPNSWIGVGESFGNAMGGTMLGVALGGVGGLAALGFATAVTDYEILYSPTQREPSRTVPTDPGSVPNKQ